MSKAQTATEYLILLAVVIVIALLVAVLIGGVPNLGGNVNKQGNDVRLSTAIVGVSDYAISDYKTIFTVRNNHAQAINVSEIYINDELCVEISPFILLKGKGKQITCHNVFSLQETDSFAVSINYSDLQTRANYVLNETDLNLVSPTVADEYLRVLDNTPSFNVTKGGCWNWTAYGELGAICTCIDLQNISVDGNRRASNFSLMNNIDVARCAQTFGGDAIGYAANWTPIGSSGSEYNGTFDGNNHHVRGITIEGNSNLGLFGDLEPATGPSATIRNLGVVKTNIVVYQITGYKIGGLVGDAEAAIINNSYSSSVFINASNTPYSSYVGGLLGFSAYANVDNSYAVGRVFGNMSSAGSRQIGGLAGGGYSSNITNSYANVHVQATYYSGGLIGLASDGRITNSYSLGTVEGNGTNMGGLVGRMYRGFVNSSYATGNVNGEIVGGLIGQIGPLSTIMNSYSRGNVNGTNIIGGLIGSTTELSNITNSRSYGKIFCQTDDCGGIVGNNRSTTKFLGTNTFVAHLDDNATNCWGGDGLVTAGANSTNCTVAS